jgi:hypothetical protein
LRRADTPPTDSYRLYTIKKLKRNDSFYEYSIIRVGVIRIIVDREAGRQADREAEIQKDIDQ